MPIDRPFEEFHNRHRAILMLLDAARPLLNLSYAEAWPALATYREQLTAAMQNFQRFKHEAIFDPIIASSRSDRPIAEKLKAGCIMLGAQYDRFRQQWTKTDVSANWPKYRLSAISMMTTIRKSLNEQDAVVRTLAPLP